MTITKLNYEVYALDYLEGTLSKEAEEAMEQFLLGHPEIAVELEAMREFVPFIPDNSVTFQHKKKLLKKEPKDKVFFLNTWQLGAAAAMLLLVAFMSLWEINLMDGQGNVAILDQPNLEEKRQTPLEIPATSLPTKENITKTEELSTSSAPLLSARKGIDVIANVVDSKKHANSKKQAINNTFVKPVPSNTSVTINSIAANASTKNSESSASNQSTINEQGPKTDSPIKNSIEAKKQIAEEVATILETKQTSNHPTVPIVAALPLANVKEVSGGLNFKEIEIDAPEFSKKPTKLLAENTPKKRTLKSMLGKLPGDRISVSILPSFFTDKGD